MKSLNQQRMDGLYYLRKQQQEREKFARQMQQRSMLNQPRYTTTASNTSFFGGLIWLISKIFATVVCAGFGYVFGGPLGALIGGLIGAIWGGQK